MMAGFSLVAGKLSVLPCTSGRTRRGIWSSAVGSLLCSLMPKPGALAGDFNLQCVIVKVRKCLASSSAREKVLTVVR